MIGQIPQRERQKIGNYRETFYLKEEEREMKREAKQLLIKKQSMEEDV